MSDEANTEPTIPEVIVTATPLPLTLNQIWGNIIKPFTAIAPTNSVFIDATISREDIGNGYTLDYNPNGILWRVNAAGIPHPDDLEKFYEQQEIHQAFSDNLAAKFTMIFGTPVVGNDVEVAATRLREGLSKAAEEIGAIAENIAKSPSNAVFKTGKTTVQDIAANPKVLSGKSAEEIAQMLREAGYDVTVEASKKSTSGAQIIKINNPGEGRNITQVQVSPGGGRHGANPYVKVSTSDQGIVKVVDGAEDIYKTDGAETAKIIFTGGK